MFSIFSIFPFVSAFFVFLVSAYVYQKGAPSRLNGVFFLFSIVISIFLFATSFLLLTDHEDTAMFWERIIYSAVAFVPPISYHFSLLVRRGIYLPEKLLLLISYLTSFAFVYLVVFTDKIIKGVYVYDWGLHSRAQVGHDYLMVFFFVFPVLVFWNFFRAYRKTDNERKKGRVKTFAVSFLILLISSSAFLPAYGVDILPLIPYSANLIFALTVAYGISRYQLWRADVQVLISYFFVIFIILIGLMELSISENRYEFSVRMIFLLIIVFFGYYVIGNVKTVVDRRDKAERLLKKLEITNRKLLRLDEDRVEMLSIVSHQLRTPLTAMRGYLSLLREEEETDKLSSSFRDILKKVFQLSDVLAQLVNNLLNTSRIDQGRMEFVFRPTDLKKLTEEVIESFAQTARERNIQIIPDLPGSNFPKVKLDAIAIREVISNLIDNAVKYTPAGGSVLVSLSRDGDRAVTLRVKDTGVGISKEDISRIFSKFVRADAGMMNTRGIGLGLYVCHNIVTAHRGQIRAFSAGTGKGSVFSITLPLDPENFG